MKNFFKKSAVVLTAAIALFVGALGVEAYSKSYSSTYDMTGGVKSAYFYAGKSASWEVTTTPTKGLSGEIIRVFLQADTVGADAVYDQEDNSSTAKDTAYLKGGSSARDDYYIYLRNYTGHQMKGSVVFKWSY